MENNYQIDTNYIEKTVPDFINDFIVNHNNKIYYNYVRMQHANDLIYNEKYNHIKNIIYGNNVTLGLCDTNNFEKIFDLIAKNEDNDGRRILLTMIGKVDNIAIKHIIGFDPNERKSVLNGKYDKDIILARYITRMVFFKRTSVFNSTDMMDSMLNHALSTIFYSKQMHISQNDNTHACFEMMAAHITIMMQLIEAVDCLLKRNIEFQINTITEVFEKITYFKRKNIKVLEYNEKLNNYINYITNNLFNFESTLYNNMGRELDNLACEIYKEYIEYLNLKDTYKIDVVVRAFDIMTHMWVYDNEIIYIDLPFENYKLAIDDNTKNEFCKILCRYNSLLNKSVKLSLLICKSESIKQISNYEITLNDTFASPTTYISVDNNPNFTTNMIKLQPIIIDMLNTDTLEKAVNVFLRNLSTKMTNRWSKIILEISDAEIYDILHNYVDTPNASALKIFLGIMVRKPIINRIKIYKILDIIIKIVKVIDERHFNNITIENMHVLRAMTENEIINVSPIDITQLISESLLRMYYDDKELFINWFTLAPRLEWLFPINGCYDTNLCYISDISKLDKAEWLINDFIMEKMMVTDEKCLQVKTHTLWFEDVNWDNVILIKLETEVAPDMLVSIATNGQYDVGYLVESNDICHVIGWYVMLYDKVRRNNWEIKSILVKGIDVGKTMPDCTKGAAHFMDEVEYLLAMNNRKILPGLVAAIVNNLLTTDRWNETNVTRLVNHYIKYDTDGLLKVMGMELLCNTNEELALKCDPEQLRMIQFKHPDSIERKDSILLQVILLEKSYEAIFESPFIVITSTLKKDEVCHLAEYIGDKYTWNSYWFHTKSPSWHRFLVSDMPDKDETMAIEKAILRAHYVTESQKYIAAIVCNKIIQFGTGFIPIAGAQVQKVSDFEPYINKPVRLRYSKRSILQRKSDKEKIDNLNKSVIAWVVLQSKDLGAVFSDNSICLLGEEAKGNKTFKFSITCKDLLPLGIFPTSNSKYLTINIEPIQQVKEYKKITKYRRYEMLDAYNAWHYLLDDNKRANRLISELNDSNKEIGRKCEFIDLQSDKL